MKKLFIILSLAVCLPAYTIEQKQDKEKKVVKDDGLKNDAIKAAVSFAAAIATALIDTKLEEPDVEHILQDPYYAPYIEEKNGKRVLKQHFVPKTVRHHFRTAKNKAAGARGTVLALIGLGSLAATAVYTGKIIYKVGKRSYNYLHRKDEESEEMQTI